MKKILILLLVLVLTLGVLVGCGGGGEEVAYEYEIINKEENSIGKAIRYSLDVVVKEKLNKEQLQELSQQIVEEAKKDDKFNAFIIGYYDYKEYVGTGYTLGRAVYGPDGDWGEADTVKAGDYKKMDFTYELMEKDWGIQLTEDEAKIYKEWQDLMLEESEKGEFPEDDEISEIVAEQNSITKEEVDDILTRQSTWTFNNKD